MTSDRGLAGAFNANVIKAVERYAASELSGASEVSLRIIGKKGNQYFSRRRANDHELRPGARPARPRSRPRARWRAA